MDEADDILGRVKGLILRNTHGANKPSAVIVPAEDWVVLCDACAVRSELGLFVSTHEKREHFLMHGIPAILGDAYAVEAD